jgi:hypothetical protein
MVVHSGSRCWFDTFVSDSHKTMTALIVMWRFICGFDIISVLLSSFAYLVQMDWKPGPLCHGDDSVFQDKEWNIPNRHLL